jgi:hypothetical protein
LLRHENRFTTKSKHGVKGCQFFDESGGEQNRSTELLLVATI